MKADWARMLLLGYFIGSMVHPAFSCGGPPPDVTPVLCASCQHVSVCVDNTLFDCIRGQWRSQECVRCIPAGEETIIGVQQVPVCVSDLPVVRHWECGP